MGVVEKPQDAENQCNLCTPQLGKDLPISKVFLRISFALGGTYFAPCGVFFLQLHGLADINSIA
jgi:hypothetical protein